MAANHVAIMRSAARHHKASEGSGDQDKPADPVGLAESTVEKSISEVSQISAISISDFEDVTSEMAAKRTQNRRPGDQPSTPEARRARARSKILTTSLEPLNSQKDLEAHVDPELQQLRLLNRLEEKWSDISANFDRVLCHLQQCSNEITLASTNCLQSLKDSIDISCDKIDEEVKALYQLISKCDEMTTKLSIAGSFRDEIKTLRKSVETLENLYKSRPQLMQQRSSASLRS